MTTCGKCGAENAAGDAFCGSCGAFLEFAAEEAAEEAAEAAGGASSPAPDDATILAPAPVVPLPATPGGGIAGAAGAAGPGIWAGGPPPALDGPICGACGRVNPGGRTFCVSCGERVATSRTATGAGAAAAGTAGAAAGAAAAGAAGTAAAPRGPREKPKPAWDFPTAPVPVAKPEQATRPEPDGDGGRSRLPLLAGLVVVVALVGGAAAFVVSGGLGGDGSAGATASPGATGAAVTTPEPTADGAPPAATPEPTAPPSEPTAPPAEPTAAPATVPPGPSVGLALTGSKASSRLAANADAKYLRDGSPASTWLSKSGAMADAWIEVTFDPAAVTRIQVWGGWQRDEPRYQGNHRPHNVTVAFDGGAPIPLELQDVLGAQRVDIPPELGIVGATRLRITIVDTYPAKKTSAKGSPSKSVAISEVRLFGVPATP
jgi:hypothetical protein